MSNEAESVLESNQPKVKCKRRTHPVMELIGVKFHKLTIIAFDGFSSARQPFYACVCDCGKETSIRVYDIENGVTRSCGCLQQSNHPQIHGHAKRSGQLPGYKSWASMVTRCTNQKLRQWDDYGGRGISVCCGLREYSQFLLVMGFRPAGTTLDRIENNGNYSCGQCAECQKNKWTLNVQWATRLQQNNNTRSNHSLYFNGQTKTMAQWSRETGISHKSIASRISRLGWSVERALTAKDDQRFKPSQQSSV